MTTPSIPQRLWRILGALAIMTAASLTLVPRGTPLGTALAASTINTTQPVQNAPYNAAPIRENFGKAANDINALQSMNLGTSPPSAPSYGTLWLQQPTSGTTYTLNIWIASANTWAPIARIDGVTGYWEPPVGGGTLPSLISAATTDLGSVPNAALYVTGAQSIASFGSSAPPGQLKFIVFTGAATLIYNATYMILPGSVNFTAGANNSAIMLSLGQGKWRMLSSGSGGGGDCDIFTATTPGCVPASGGGTVNFLRADGTWVPPGGNTEFTIAAGFTNTVGTLNTGNQTIANNSTLSEQFWVTNKIAPYIVNADNGGTSDTGVFLVATAPGIIFSAPNPSAGTKGNSYQFGTDGTNGFTVTTVGGAATLYGCAGPNTGATSFAFDALDVQIVDDGTNYKCVTAAPIAAADACTVSGTTNTVMKFTSATTCGDSHITDDGIDITATAGESGAFSAIGGAGTGAGTGGAINLTSGAGGATGTGGGVTVTAGAAGASAGGGGTVAITAGAGEATAGQGGAINLVAGNGHIGGNVTLTAGDSGAVSQAGSLLFSAGNHGAGGGAGGIVQFITGNSVGGAGGAFTVVTGDGADIKSGDISFTTGSTTGANTDGGGISFGANGGSGAGAGGGVGASAGAGGATGPGGMILFTAGDGGFTSGNGGAISLTAGGSRNGTAGAITLAAGTGVNTGDGGAVTITSGASGASGAATGGITLTAAAATATSSTIGGAVAITAGAGNLSAAGGAITATTGAGGLTGAGGGFTVVAGAGGATSGAGGAIDMGTGASPNGAGGSFNITIATGGGSNGNLTITGLPSVGATTGKKFLCIDTGVSPPVVYIGTGATCI